MKKADKLFGANIAIAIIGLTLALLGEFAFSIYYITWLGAGLYAFSVIAAIIFKELGKLGK